MVNINIEIDKLIDFALDKNMISKWDIELSRNEILDLLDLDSYEETAYEKRYQKVLWKFLKEYQNGLWKIKG